MGTGILEDPPNPETPEVQQREILAPALLVHPDGPVGVKELPSQNGAAFTETIAAADTTPHKMLAGPDEKRKLVRLAADQAFYVSFKSTSGSGAYVPANTQVVIGYIGQIWVRAATSNATNVGAIVEYWAE